MKGLTEPMLEMESYRQILEGIEQGRTPVFATGVIDAAKSHLLDRKSTRLNSSH